MKNIKLNSDDIDLLLGALELAIVGQKNTQYSIAVNSLIDELKTQSENK